MHVFSELIFVTCMYHYVLDIDECDSGISNCGQICNNTVGNFECSCDQGYELDNDSVTCLGKNAIEDIVCMYVAKCGSYNFRGNINCRH